MAEKCIPPHIQLDGSVMNEIYHIPYFSEMEQKDNGGVQSIDANDEKRKKQQRHHELKSTLRFESQPRNWCVNWGAEKIEER